MRGTAVFWIGVAILFGVLIASTIKGSTLHKTVFGVLASAVAFVSLYGGSWVYDRWILRGPAHDDPQDHDGASR